MQLSIKSSLFLLALAFLHVGAIEHSVLHKGIVYDLDQVPAACRIEVAEAIQGGEMTDAGIQHVLSRASGIRRFATKHYENGRIEKYVIFKKSSKFMYWDNGIAKPEELPWTLKDILFVAGGVGGALVGLCCLPSIILFPLIFF